MALKNIVDKINSDVDSEIRKIIGQAETEAGKIVSMAEEQASRLRERMIVDGREKAQKEKDRIVMMALLEGKKAVLNEKQKILDMVYDEVKKRIKNLNDKAYRELMRKLIINGCKTKEVKIIVGKDDKRRIDKKLIDGINKSMGSKHRIILVDENTQIQDGFILRYGKTEMDNSLDSIVGSLREKTIDELAKVLFK